MAATAPLNLTGSNAAFVANLANWKFFLAAYRGATELLKLGKVPQHERESTESYNARKARAVSFGFSKLVVSLLNQYLLSKPATYNWAGLETNPEFAEFLTDADYRGQDYESVIGEWSRNASIMGHAVLIVDKPAGPLPDNLEATGGQRVYPYLTGYWASQVLDWNYTYVLGRPKLTYLKLAEGENIKIWEPSHWQLWNPKGELVSEGENAIGVIPAVWLYANRPMETENIGLSDIEDVAPLDLSILLNGLDAQQVIEYAAFPMMLMPSKKSRAGVGTPTSGTPQDQDVVGPTSVLEFDPENPQAKPGWLEAKVKEPIEAILSWMKRQEEAVYQSAGLSGIVGRTTADVPSGVALALMFQQLNARLAAKARNLEEAEQSIIALWQLWQGTSYPVTIARPKDYAIQDSAVDLQTVLQALGAATTKALRMALEQRIQELAAPAMTEAEVDAMKTEMMNQTRQNSDTKPTMT